MAKKQKKSSFKLSWLLVLNAWVVFGLIIWQIMTLNMLPNNFLVLIGVILGLITFDLTIYSKSKIGIAALLLFVIGGFVGTYYLYQTNVALNSIVETPKVYHSIDVYADKGSGLADQFALKDEVVGVLRDSEYGYTSDAIDLVQYDLQKNLRLDYYDTISDLLAAYENGEIRAFFLSPSVAKLYNNNNDNYIANHFNSIYRAEIEEKEASQLAANDKITTEPFVIYLSGSDTRDEEIGLYDRSDVNILAIINPRTKNVLFITTPRDYYVPLSVSYGMLDKLTHAGVYGIDCSMDTLEMLYEIEEIRYFAKINFVGFEKIVDAVGGIDVYSEIAFDAKSGDEYATNFYHIEEGMQHLKGEAALAFVRERAAFEDGDVQRGKNQVTALKALFDKLKSPAVLTGYTQLLAGIEGCIETNMPREDLEALVKMQLSDGANWKIEQVAVEGWPSMGSCYAMGPTTQLYVYEPDYDTVNYAIEMIDKTMVGDYEVGQIILDNQAAEEQAKQEEQEKMELFDRIERILTQITEGVVGVSVLLVILKIYLVVKNKKQNQVIEKEIEILEESADE